MAVSRLLVVPPNLSRISVMSYKRLTSTVLHALSRVPIEAVIAMAVWAHMGGRQLTLKESVVFAVRAIPGVVHRPFRLFVSRVFTVSLLYSVISVPYQTASILIFAFEHPRGRTAVLLITASLLGAIFETLVDSRLLALIPVAAIERGGVLQSIRRCWRLTSRHWARILGVLLLLAVVVAPVTISAGMLTGWVAYHRHRNVRLLVSVLTLFVRILVRVYEAVLAAVCYRHTRVADGEIAPEEAAVPPTA